MARDGAGVEPDCHCFPGLNVRPTSAVVFLSRCLVSDRLMYMKWKLTITNHEEQARSDREFWRSRSPEERLDAVETLRIEAGKFLYEYPSCAGYGDFKELLQLLEEHRVDYMIVGGYALAFHGFPRFTQDIDIFFELSLQNVARLREALIEFGFAEEDLPEGAFTTTGNILTFGVPPSRVDLLNDIDGVPYGKAKPNIVRGKYGDVGVNFIGREDLIKNKLATPRLQDKLDIQARTQKDRQEP